MYIIYKNNIIIIITIITITIITVIIIILYIYIGGPLEYLIFLRFVLRS